MLAFSTTSFKDMVKKFANTSKNITTYVVLGLLVSNIYIYIYIWS